MPNNRDKYFKGQQDSEEFICFFRHHWIVLLRELTYFGLFMTGVVISLMNYQAITEILRGNYELKLLFLTVFILSTIYVHRFFMKMLNYFLEVGIITDVRIIDHDRTLFFRDTMDSIDLSQIQNVEQIKEGIIPNIFKFGDIVVFLTASSATKTFYTVPNAKFHFRCLNRAKEARQTALRVMMAREEERQSLDPQKDNQVTSKVTENSVLPRLIN